VKAKSEMFRKEAGPYVLAAALGRKNGQSAERLKLRNQLITEHRLDRDIYQSGLRGAARPDDSVFGPLVRFANLPEEKFAQQAPDVLAAVVRGGDRRRPINSLVVEAFKGLGAESLKSINDVADVYTKLFASIDGKAKAYIDACRAATDTTTPPTGYDPALVELINVPAEIIPAAALSTDKLREIAPRLPVVNGQAYNRFKLAEINELQLTHPGSPARAMVVADAPKPRNSFVFIRGEQQNRGPLVPRQFLEILSGPNRHPFTQGSGRLELANAIANKDNPLTARVMVNRVWMHHLGQAFVRTPDDLGVQSEKPSHPELLDYLATYFVEHGWSIKQMHRLVMLSSTYQQSSDTNEAYSKIDPENRLLWRANLRRLDFEAVRDSMLVFTGNLDETIGGKPVNLSDEPYSDRRSVYGYIDRGDLPELLDQFDVADPDRPNSQRVSTIVPQQALFFMNSPMAVDVARKVTSRPEFLKARDDAARVAALYEVLFQRAPRPEEIKLGVRFVRDAADEQKRQAVVQAMVAPPQQAPQQTRREQRMEKQAARRVAMQQPSAEQAQRREQMIREKRKQQMQAQQAAQAMQRRRNGRAAIRNEGAPVDRSPLTPWQQYAQALLFANEMVYVN
jgi:hypothetical protein